MSRLARQTTPTKPVIGKTNPAAIVFPDAIPPTAIMTGKTIAKTPRTAAVTTVHRIP